MSSTRKSAQGNKKNYSKEGKLALGELVEKYKKEYDEEVQLNVWSFLLFLVFFSQSIKMFCLTFCLYILNNLQSLTCF